MSSWGGGGEGRSWGDPALYVDVSLALTSALEIKLKILVLLNKNGVLFMLVQTETTCFARTRRLGVRMSLR